MRTNAAEVFWGASIGVSKYELSVTMASFGTFTTLVEEPNFFTEPTYVLFVRVTNEKAQSAGLRPRCHHLVLPGLGRRWRMHVGKMVHYPIPIAM